MKKSLLTACVATALLLAAGANAKQGEVPTASERAELIKSGATKAPHAWSAYIVRLADAPVARYRGGVKGLAATSPAVTGQRKVDTRSSATADYLTYLASQQSAFLAAAEKSLNRKIDVISTYRYANNGMALWITSDEAQQLSNMKDVLTVEREKLRPLLTDAGPEWIGAPSIWDGTATNDSVASLGEGIILGIIDTGVNHDHPSFADIGPVDMYDHVNPLSEYKGLCDGTTGLPYCNDKLIGVYDCNAGGTSAGGDGSGNTPPLGPQVRLLSGGPWTGATCAAFDGPHVFANAGGTTIEFTVNTTNPADDVFMNLHYRPTALDPWTQVVTYDFLFGLETTTYSPSGGIPVGEYAAEICAFDGIEPIGPATYTGSLTWNDLAVSGTGDACSGGQPEDANQHGSHTASTAGGNKVSADIVAPTITIQRTLQGVAPHANIITYAGCLPAQGCLGVSLANAIEQIVIDGVDVVNYSIGGGPSNPWGDSDSQGFLSAREAGIWVATSASNDGPGAGSIGSPADAPWVTTVGASTHNRVLANQVEMLSGGNTAPPFTEILGKGLTSDYPAGTGTAAIIYAGDTPADDMMSDSGLCGVGDGTAPATPSPWAGQVFSGEIVVCDRGLYARVDKCKNVCDAGAGGCILANNAASGDSLVADGHSCPSVHISHDDGVALKAWLADGATPGSHQGRISGSFSDLAPINGDVQAGFSSRGPNSSAQNNLKPDVTNPGVDILAAVNTVGNTVTVGADEYGSLSGTSMSSPHTAGAYALLKAKRPEFSPSEAQSAFMMTSTRALTRDSNATDAGDPFDRGAGRVDLTQAAKAALVMHEADYGSTPADAKALNIPSFADSNCQSTCFWMREVKSAADTAVTWTAGYSSEDGVIVSVTPSVFTLAPGATQMITVTADIAAAVHATPQGPAGPGIENETQDLDADGVAVFNACTGAAGDSKDCWVFADVSLTPSTAVPSVSMPLAARSTGDADADGIKDLVDNCPTHNSTDIDQTDTDTDGVGDVCDNCLLVANPDQCNTNGDIFGNVCDADLDNNGIVNSFDLGIMRTNFGAGGINDSDLTCDGIVNSFDLQKMREAFGGMPGPSGLTP